jgi:hypothetical protein
MRVLAVWIGLVLGSWALLSVAVILLVLGIQTILDRAFG